MAKELDALLKQVDELEARGLARQCFDGIAVGRNADELHLAGARGIYAIPLGQIDEVAPIGRTNPRAVTVFVRDVASVRLIKPASRLAGMPNPDDPTPWPFPDPFGNDPPRPKYWPPYGPRADSDGGPTKSATEPTETSSVSGGVADDSDDFVMGITQDD